MANEEKCVVKSHPQSSQRLVRGWPAEKWPTWSVEGRVDAAALVAKSVKKNKAVLMAQSDEKTEELL